MAARWQFAVLVLMLVTAISLAQAPATKKPATPVAPKSTEAKAKEKDTGPLTLKDVLQLRPKMTPDDILGKALERGIDFEVTKPIQLQLAKLGFTPTQLENLQSARGIEPLPPIIAGQHTIEDDAQKDALYKQYEEITLTVAKDYVPIQTAHVTLWAPKALQAALLAEVKKLDSVMEAKFQEPIRSGLDKRTAHLVFLRNRAETIAWFEKHLEVTKLDLGEMMSKEDHLTRCANGAMTNLACVQNLEAIQPQKLPNRVGVYVGYMAMQQLTNYTESQPLISGFANGIEGVLVGMPETPYVARSYGVEERYPNGGGKPWLVIAKERLAAGKLTPPSALLKLTPANMNIPEFVESWTLVDLLVRDRVKFGKLVYKLRDERDGLKAIEAVYGWNEAELFKQWQLHVAK